MSDNERSSTPTAGPPPIPPPTAVAQSDKSACAPTQSKSKRPSQSKRDREEDDEVTRHSDPTAEVGGKERAVAQRSLGRVRSTHRNKRNRREIWIRTQDLSLPKVWETLKLESGKELLDRADAPGVDRGHFCPQLLGLQGALDSRVPSFIKDWGRPDCTPSTDTMSCYVHRLNYSRDVFQKARIVRTCLSADPAKQQLDEDADWLDQDGVSESYPHYVMGWMDRYASGTGAKVAWWCDCTRPVNEAMVFDSIAIEMNTWEEAHDWYNQRITSAMARLGWQEFPTDVDIIQLEEVVVAASAPAATLPVTAYVLHLLTDFDNWMYPNLDPRLCPAESGPQTLQSEWLTRLRIAQADFLQAGIGKETLKAIIDSRSEDS